jgi:hypothetical protein
MAIIAIWMKTRRRKRKRKSFLRKKNAKIESDLVLKLKFILD